MCGNKFILTIILISTIGTASCNITSFLEGDNTNENEYLPWYTCGHFARDLARNASENNLTIGSIMLGVHPTFRGHSNHLANYYIHNNTIMIIQPQTDEILPIEQTIYIYYRLYPDGTQIPTYWKGNRAHTGIIGE